MEENEEMDEGLQQAPLVPYPTVQTKEPATPPASPIQGPGDVIQTNPLNTWEKSKTPTGTRWEEAYGETGQKSGVSVEQGDDGGKPEIAVPTKIEVGSPMFADQPWEKVATRFKLAFPDMDQSVIERDYRNASELARARRRLQDVDTSQLTNVEGGFMAGAPFLGPLMKTANETEYQQAMQRLKAGTPRGQEYTKQTGRPDDFDTIAFWEKQQGDKSNQGMASHVTQGLLGGGRFLAEQATGGVIGKAFGLGAAAANALGLATASAGSALETSAERASAKGDDSRFYSPSNAIPATAMSGIQALILHGAGKFTQGITNPIAKVAADIGTQFGAMQGTEVAAGGLDEFLAPAWKTNTQYGVIGKILAGHQGEALQETVSQVLTIAALSALHVHGREIPKRLMDTITDAINDTGGPESKPGGGSSTNDEFGETGFDSEATRRRYEEARARQRQQSGGQQGESTWDGYEREQEEAFQRRQGNRRSQQDGPNDAAERVKTRVEATAHDILGVKPDATMDEITRAYRKRATETHPDRGGDVDQFKWVDWAYKTLQARAGSGKAPKSRPRNPYDPGKPASEQQAPPYEGPQGETGPEQPQEPTAKTAADPENAPEAPPSPPGEQPPEAPPVAENAVPEPIPDGIRARFDDLVERRQQARAADDFETEMSTGRDISDLIKEHPRLRETSTYAKPRPKPVDPSDLGEQTPRQKLDALEDQLRSARTRLAGAKNMERKELMTKEMGLSHRADEAGEHRKGWESRVNVLQDKVDAARDEMMRGTAKPKEGPKLPGLTPEQLAGRPWEGRDLGERPPRPSSRYIERMRENKARRQGSPREQVGPVLPRGPKTWVHGPTDLEDLMLTTDQIHDVAGLNPAEKHLMNRLLGGEEKPTFEELAKDPKLPPTTGPGIHAMSVRVLGKLGYQGTVEDFFKQQKEEVQRQARANGVELEHGALGNRMEKAEGQRRSVMNRVTKEEARVNRWRRYVEELQKDGPLTKRDRDSIADSINKGEQPPGYGETKRGLKLAAKNKRNGEAPVPSSPASGVSQDPAQQPAAAPQKAKRGNRSVTGGPAKAAGSQLTKEQKLERMRRGRAVPKEYEAEAVRMGYSPETLHGLALQTAALDRATHTQTLGALQYARKMAKGMGFPGLGTIRARNTRGIDADKVKGLDVVAVSTAKAYPELFGPDESTWQEKLFDMLAAGNPKRLTETETYEVAMKHLADIKEATTVNPEEREELNNELKAQSEKPFTDAEIAEAEREAREQSLRAQPGGHPGELQGEEEGGQGSDVSPELFGDDSFDVADLDRQGPSVEPQPGNEPGPVAAGGQLDAGDAGRSGDVTNEKPWAIVLTTRHDTGETLGNVHSTYDTNADAFRAAYYLKDQLKHTGVMIDVVSRDDLNKGGVKAKPGEIYDTLEQSEDQPVGDLPTRDEIGVAYWGKRFEDAPPGTQTNFLPGNQGSLVGEHRDLFDMTPRPKEPKTYQGFKEQRNFLDQADKIAKQFLSDEGGAVDLKQIATAARYAQDSVARLSGKMVPATTRADRKTGESLARWMVASKWGREAAPFYTDLIVGKDATTHDRVLAGAMLTEMRLGFMRAAYRRLGGAANVTAANDAARRARVALRAGIKLKKQTAKAAAGKPPGSPEQRAHEQVKAAVKAARKTADDLEKKAKVIRGHDKTANGVSSLIGAPGSPFPTRQDFFNFRDSPTGKQIQKNWRDHFVPVMESLYERSMGRKPANIFTQIPGLPISIHPVRPGDQLNRPGVISTSGGKGPRRLKFKKYKFAEVAKGNADAYHTDIQSMIENVLSHGADLAAKADFARMAVQQGQAKFANPGQQIAGMQAIPFTSPPKGTGLGRAGQTLYVKDEIHGEVMHGFDSDTPESAIRVLRMINNIPMVANLASFVDASSHGVNLALALTAPSGKWFGMTRNSFGNIMKKIRGNEQIQRDLLELTRIGANKPHHAGEGMMVGAAQKIADWTGRSLPERVKKGKYIDPTFYLSHAMDHASDVVRLALSSAFDEQVKAGNTPDTETNRRDYINQMTGQYEAKAMNWMARMFRETGFGPFVVAGTTMNARAIKSLVASTGMKGQGWKGEARLRRDFTLKMLALLGLGAAFNFARWGRVDGDENTPRFGIKLYEGADGKSVNWPNPVGVLLNRGMRAVPFLSYLVDHVTGQSPPTESESKIYDAADAWLHPFAGPTPQFLHTLITGNDMMGRKIAEPAGETSSKPRENLKAAAKQANPVYSALSGAYKPGEEIPLNERMAKLMGPFGFRYTEKQPHEIASLYDLGARLREVHDQQRHEAKKAGQNPAPDTRFNIVQRAMTSVSRMEKARRAPGLTQEERQEIRTRQVNRAKIALGGRESVEQ